MSGFSEAEFQRVAADLKAGLDEAGFSGRLFSVDSHEQNELAKSLAESHPILAISLFPLDVGANEDLVTLEWASGLTGGYMVEIWLHPNPPDKWADPPRSGSPGSHFIPKVTYIYDSVAAISR